MRWNCTLSQVCRRQVEQTFFYFVQRPMFQHNLQLMKMQLKTININ